MSKHPHELTPKQFYKHHLREIMREYGLSRKEAENSLIEPTSWTHARLVQEAARSGKQIPHKVLDKLTSDNLRYLLKFFPEAVDGYMPPSVRAANIIRELEFKAAKHSR